MQILVKNKIGRVQCGNMFKKYKTQLGLEIIQIFVHWNISPTSSPLGYRSPFPIVIYSHNKYAYIHIHMFMQHHNDSINN